MSKPFEPFLAFHLGGTVCIPTSFPTPGRITLGKIVDRRGNTQPAANLLRVEHRLSDRVLIARTIRMTDVRAIWLADDPNNPKEFRDLWVLSGEDRQMEKVSKTLKSARSRPPRKTRATKSTGAQDYLIGSVFVPEGGNVLMDVSVGMTAAESAEYYPPLVHDRSDVHYNLQDCH